MGWGYHGGSGTSFADKFKQNKKLINETSAGTKIYEYKDDRGVLSINVIWKDNRNNNFPSCFIIKNYYNKSKLLIIPEELKTQKDIFIFLNNNLENVLKSL
jgi:hypothetical protein